MLAERDCAILVLVAVIAYLLTRPKRCEFWTEDVTGKSLLLVDGDGNISTLAISALDRYALKTDVYNKEQSDATFAPKSLVKTVTDNDTTVTNRLNGMYTKTQANNNFALKANTYTKADVNRSFANVYTKTAADGRYARIHTPYQMMSKNLKWKGQNVQEFCLTDKNADLKSGGDDDAAEWRKKGKGQCMTMKFVPE